nr:hypothetical protein [Tanacetum cinerariifolium]
HLGRERRLHRQRLPRRPERGPSGPRCGADPGERQGQAAPGARHRVLPAAGHHAPERKRAGTRRTDCGRDYSDGGPRPALDLPEGARARQLR